MRSCKDYAQSGASATGLYTVYDNDKNPYQVFCEMEADKGGWTLVASIHENDINGKCTAGGAYTVLPRL